MPERSTAENLGLLFSLDGDSPVGEEKVFLLSELFSYASFWMIYLRSRGRSQLNPPTMYCQE